MAYAYNEDAPWAPIEESEGDEYQQEEGDDEATANMSEVRPAADTRG